MTELHGLSSSCPFVQQGSVGHWHAGDVTNHGLVVEERLQATLRDFGLVGCVLSYPDNGTGTVSRAAWFRTRGQQHKSRGRRRRGSGQWNALCDFLMLEICRKSKNHLASHEWRSQGLWLKAASLNYSNFISYFRCSEGSVICQHSPAWIFQQIALDGRRYWAVVVTHADVGPPHFVHRCDLLQGLQDLILACQVFQKIVAPPNSQIFVKHDSLWATFLSNWLSLAWDDLDQPHLYLFSVSKLIQVKTCNVSVSLQQRQQWQMHPSFYYLFSVI